MTVYVVRGDIMFWDYQVVAVYDTLAGAEAGRAQIIKQLTDEECDEITSELPDIEYAGLVIDEFSVGH